MGSAASSTSAPAPAEEQQQQQASAGSSGHHPRGRRGSSSSSAASPPAGVLQQQQQRQQHPPSNPSPLEQLRAECLGLDIEVPPHATQAELLELLARERNSKQNQKRPSLWTQATDAYEELVRAIVRPPRAEYPMEALGRKAFQVDGAPHERVDFALPNERGLQLQVSWWRPIVPATGGGGGVVPPSPRPCIVYMHGNSSCRAEALEPLREILGTGFSLVAFDFAGSGKSDGEYVSLGYFEKDDLQCVVRHLRESNRVSAIGLWGRSMGAVTALMFAGERDPCVACMVCDSPFSSLRTLARELVDSAQLNVPRFAVGLGLRMVRSSVRSRANFDINALEPIATASKCFVPTLFAAAEGDAFIKPHHAREIFDAFAGDKTFKTFPGDHNSRRPTEFIHSAIIFMYNCMVHDGLQQQQQHQQRHSVGIDAQEFHMPAPLAPTPRSRHLEASFNPYGAGASSSSRSESSPVRPPPKHDQDDEGEFFDDGDDHHEEGSPAPSPSQTPGLLDFAFLDEDAALQRALELSLLELNSNSNHMD